MLYSKVFKHVKKSSESKIHRKTLALKSLFNTDALKLLNGYSPDNTGI